MLDGLVSFEEKINDVEGLFEEMYAHQPEFANFPWDLERYKARFQRIQTAVKRLKWAAKYDKECLAEARTIYGIPTHYPNGKPVWRGSNAAKQLDQDLVNGFLDDKDPLEVFEMHECYKEFGVKRLGQRLDQLKESAKPYGENPMQTAANRAKKEKKDRSKLKNRPEISRLGTVEAYNNSG